MKKNEQRESNSVIYINGLPWKIMIEREKARNEDSLGFYACCNEDDTYYWSLDAMVNYRLKPARPGANAKPFTKKLPFSKFTKASHSRGHRDFCKWEDVISPHKGFITADGSITCEINVDAKPVERLVVPKHTLTHMFGDIRNMHNGAEQISESTMYIHGAPWKLCIARKHHSLAIYVYCDFDDGSDWTCKAFVECRLLPTKAENEAKTESFTHEYNAKHKGYGCRNFIDWKDLINIEKGYISDEGSISCQIVVDAKHVQRTNN